MRMIIFIEYFLIYKIDKSHIIIDSKVRISFSMKINFFFKKRNKKAPHKVTRTIKSILEKQFRTNSISYLFY